MTSLKRLVGVAFLLAVSACHAPETTTRLTSAERSTDEALRAWREAGTRTIVLRVEERDRIEDVARAAARVRERGFQLAYWIEVARSPSLADEHPEWMASLQGHEAWRQPFKTAPIPRRGEVVKVYPWVPITSAEGYRAQLARLTELFLALPVADILFLNDLQGAPSACGCGHPLCRWTTDYFLKSEAHPEPIVTTTPLEPDAALRFARKIAALLPETQVIPVWVAECGPDDAECHGVPCYTGRCWPALAEQWLPLVSGFRNLAVFLPSRSIGRSPASSWMERELTLLAERHGAVGFELERDLRSRLIPVVEGDEVTLGGAIVSDVPIDQSWEPRVHAPR